MKPRKFQRPRDDKQGLTFWRGLPYSWSALRGPQDGKWSSALFFCRIPAQLFAHKTLLPVQEKEYIYPPDDYALYFQQGDEAGLQYFFDRYYRRLYLYALKLVNDEGLAEETAVNAFFQTWKQRAQFTSANSIKAYLYTVVKNGCSRFLLKRSKQKSVDASLLLYPEKTAYDAMVYAETMTLLYEAIATLPQQCGKVIKYLYVDGRTVAETARDLKLSVNSIKTHRQRGIVLLRNRLIRTIRLCVVWCVS